MFAAGAKARWGGRPTQRGAAAARRAAAAALCGALIAAAAPAAAQASTWVVTGPAPLAERGPQAVVALDEATGTVSLAVSRGGRTVLEPSPVGIVTERADLASGLRFLGRTDRRVAEYYTTTVGKELQRHVQMTEARFAFAGAEGARLDLVVRASDDGIAYRYVLPEDLGAVLGEASAFNVPADATAWLARHRRDYENPFIRYTASTAPTAEFMTPALFDVDGTYLFLAESDLDGSYSGSRLVHTTGSGSYGLKLWDPAVAVDGPLATPWRAMVVGDLATVAESTLIDDLAPDSRIADTRWIRPGAALWTWLAGGRTAGQSLERQKEYVDYAAARGWPYEAVDAGWYFDPNQWDVTDPNWQTNSWMPELVRYGRERGVRIIVWIHYRDLDTAEERAQWLPTLERWGVAGVKIDFMDSESQERLKWYDEILPATAAHHLLVNFHGSNIPKGIHRTWPHVVTMEGVHGGEKSSNLTTSHITALPFTRNVVGSMDYTPEAFHRTAPRRPTSDANELALSVVFESGVQNFAGTPESYDARPEARRFLEQVPTVWDETRLLAGRPAEGAVFARRSGARWFVGGSFSGPARTVRAPLDIQTGLWLVDLVRDGPAGLVREQRVMRDGDELAVDIAAEGGFAAIACRWHAGIETCDR
jgi:alpha-glucosidase